MATSKRRQSKRLKYVNLRFYFYLWFSDDTKMQFVAESNNKLTPRSAARNVVLVIVVVAINAAVRNVVIMRILLVMPARR